MAITHQIFKRSRTFFMYQRATHTITPQHNNPECSLLNRAPLQEMLKSPLHIENPNVCIYKVPKNIRQVETEAYEPNMISIGPYHHGKSRLQEMEKVKWQFFHRLFHPQDQKDSSRFDHAVNAVKSMEEEARSCYFEKIKMRSDQFVDMMLIDGCFIIELFRRYHFAFEQNAGPGRLNNFILRRWMLPVLRQDLIMIENQIPLQVLNKLLEVIGTGTGIVTSTSAISSNVLEPSIQELAMCFFRPLMPCSTSHSSELNEKSNEDPKHLLDFLRSTILPRDAANNISNENISRGKEPYLFRSMTELKEALIKVRAPEDNNQVLLNISFEKGVLKIPQFCINDYRCTLYRNMVAFEQCHKACKPDVTRYLFLIDKLINSARDVDLLHYAGVLQHSLGNNKDVARTVNKLCKEVCGDMEESYLYKVVQEMEKHCTKKLNKNLAYLKHNYFPNVWVTASTVAAFFLIHLTVIQTCADLADDSKMEKLMDTAFWELLMMSLFVPFISAYKVFQNIGSLDKFRSFWLFEN